MIYQQIRERIEHLTQKYISLSKGNEHVLDEIAMAEIPEMVYHSNAIENSTLSLEETENILLGEELKGRVNIEVGFRKWN